MQDCDQYPIRDHSGKSFLIFMKSVFDNCIFYISLVFLKHSNIMLFSERFAKLRKKYIAMSNVSSSPFSE